MRISIDPRIDAHRWIPSPGPGAEPCADLIERAGLPRVPALPRELDGVGVTPDPVARAIEDLKRSGYRPLHACLTGSDHDGTGHRELVAAPMWTRPEMGA